MFKNNKKINNDLSDKIEYLVDKINNLQAEIYKLKHPKGKLHVDSVVWGNNSIYNIFFTCSDETKIHNIKLGRTKKNFDHYKILVKDNIAYIGIKFNDNNEEIYYIVDIVTETPISISNGIIEEFKKIEWKKHE